MGILKRLLYGEEDRSGSEFIINEYECCGIFRVVVGF